MEIKKGLVFTGKWFTGRVKVLEISEAENILIVSLQQEYETFISNWNEDWNLQHTIIGFEQGDYFIKNEK